ncbi:MAG: hypothetical protein ACK5MH_09050 [Bacteroidales bacterium]
MAIKMITQQKQIESYLKQCSEQVHKETVRVLSYIGERCIIEARDRSQKESWIDRTGNLRSSVGYVIVANGEIVAMSDFKQVNDGSEGIYRGERYARTIAAWHRTGYALIVVAGMSYASFVEAMENKVVLASAETLAMKIVPEIMNELKKRIEEIYNVDK